jgi:hypothetical protein
MSAIATASARLASAAAVAANAISAEAAGLEDVAADDPLDVAVARIKAAAARLRQRVKAANEAALSAVLEELAGIELDAADLAASEARQAAPAVPAAAIPSPEKPAPALAGTLPAIPVPEPIRERMQAAPPHPWERVAAAGPSPDESAMIEDALAEGGINPQAALAAAIFGGKEDLAAALAPVPSANGTAKRRKKPS